MLPPSLVLCAESPLLARVAITNVVPQAIDLLPREAWQNPQAIHSSSETGCGLTREIRRSTFGSSVVDGRAGVHDALISEDLFNAVQRGLSGGNPHEIERDDFPLRGFVRCSKCGKNLTAGWVKGRSKLYSRYWCFTKGCRGVSVSSEELETRLHWLFIAIQPEAHLLAKLPVLAARSWESRKERIAFDARALRRRLEDQQTLNRQTIEARVRGTLNDSDFRTMKASIDAEIERIQAQIRSLDSERCTMEDIVKQTEREVINFGESWKQANPKRKREIQAALFPEGLVYDQNSFFLNRFNRSLLIDLTEQTDPQFIEEYAVSLVGVPDGI
jgi:site-specific DNA recombinase